MLTQAQLQGLGGLLHMAFKEIRLLGWDGKAEQAADLADAICQLPLRMYSERFSWEGFEHSLRDYQERYPNRTPDLDYARWLRRPVDYLSDVTQGQRAMGLKSCAKV